MNPVRGGVIQMDRYGSIALRLLCHTLSTSFATRGGVKAWLYSGLFTRGRL
jgi:hypothetical protein